MTRSFRTLVVMFAAGWLLPLLPAAAQVHPHQEAQIRKAAPEKPRAAPKRPRTVLIWNPVIMQFYLDAIQFACGDLDAPTAPRAGD